MPLPIPPPPRSTDVAILGWAGITVRIAWTLLGLGIKPKADLVSDLRAHVLYHLDPTTPVPHAEDLATRLTEEFLARGAAGRATLWPTDWDVPIAQRWRRTLDGLLDEPSRLVFRKHYGDRRALEWIVQHVSAGGKPVELSVIAAVRDGLRDAARHIGRQDGLGTDGWAAERVDRFLQRLAAYAPPPCPRVLDVSEGCYPEHVAVCPRCDRMLRLLQHEELSLDDLQPPLDARPTHQVKVLALHLHPQGRKARRRLREALSEQSTGSPAWTHGPDLLILDGERPDRYVDALVMAAELGEPAREHIRGVLLEGPGHWTTRGLVGPLPERAAQEVLYRPWGAVDAIGELPPALPTPPSAAGIWALVGALALVALVLLPWTFQWYPWQHAPPERTAAFALAEKGTWVQFDAPELDRVTIVTELSRTLVTKLPGRSAIERAPLAVGDGTFRTWVEGDGALVAISERAVPDLPEIVDRAQAEPQPLAALAGALAAQEGVSVYWHHR